MASEEVIYDMILCDQRFSLLKNVVVKGTETSYRARRAGCSAVRLLQLQCHYYSYVSWYAGGCGSSYDCISVHGYPSGSSCVTIAFLLRTAQVLKTDLKKSIS